MPTNTLNVHQTHPKPPNVYKRPTKASQRPPNTLNAHQTHPKPPNVYKRPTKASQRPPNTLQQPQTKPLFAYVLVEGRHELVAGLLHVPGVGVVATPGRAEVVEAGEAGGGVALVDEPALGDREDQLVVQEEPTGRGEKIRGCKL
jgi:hypothetical protein